MVFKGATDTEYQLKLLSNYECTEGQSQNPSPNLWRMCRFKKKGNSFNLQESGASKTKATAYISICIEINPTLEQLCYYSYFFEIWVKFSI